MSADLQRIVHQLNAAANRVKAWSRNRSDPPNAFHALRQFLLQNGIDSRIFSFGTLPVPQAIACTNTASMGTLDNTFFFEFYKRLTPDVPNRSPVNVLVLLVRCFFEDTQDSDTMHAQLVLNHHRDAVYELNEVYDYLILEAVSDNWTKQDESKCGRITLYEKKYTGIDEFKAFVLKLQGGLALLKANPGMHFAN